MNLIQVCKVIYITNIICTCFHVVNNILISQAGREGYYVGVIELKLSKYKKVDERLISTVSMTQEMPDHDRVMDLVKYYEDTSGLINRKKLKALHGTDH